jgi:hypothetical protein
MGWYDLKYSLIIMISIQLVSMIMVMGLPDYMNMKVGTTGATVVNLFYHTDQMTVDNSFNGSYAESNQGDIITKSTTWTTANNTGILSKYVFGVMDIFWYTTGGISEAIKTYYSLIFAPAYLLDAWLSNSGLTFLWWLPIIFYVLFPILFIINLISIFIGK